MIVRIGQKAEKIVLAGGWQHFFQIPPSVDFLEKK